jgi:endo-1,4-beta-xylanase
MKFDALEPSRNTFSYTAADAIVAQAVANGQVMRCHNLVWHSQVPAWVSPELHISTSIWILTPLR